MDKRTGILKFLGYFLATTGGVLGIPPALLLTGKKEKESINSGRIILFTALSAVIFFSIMVNGFMVNYFERVLLFYFILSAVTGAIIARTRKDYILRGFFLSLFTGLLGIAVILFTEGSKARSAKADKHDYHNWPPQQGLAPILLLGQIFFLVIIKKIFNI